MYTVDYFIKKFEAIPEENWITGFYFNQDKTKFCALGHCDGHSGSDEAEALFVLFPYPLDTNVADVNDGKNWQYQQATPKQRILAALYDIKSNEAVEQVEEIIATPHNVTENT